MEEIQNVLTYCFFVLRLCTSVISLITEIKKYIRNEERKKSA